MIDERIRNVLFYPLVVILFLAIQSAQIFVIGDIHPDLIMILSIIYAFSRGVFKGEIFGFIVGLLLDLMSGTLFGLNAFILTLLGLCSTYFQRIVKVANIIVFIIYIIFATICKYVLYQIFLHLYQNTQLWDLYFLWKIPGEMLVNIVSGVLLYIVISRFDTGSNYEWF